MNYVGERYDGLEVLLKINLKGFKYDGYYICKKDDGTKVRMSETEIYDYSKTHKKPMRLADIKPKKKRESDWDEFSKTI